MRSSRIKSRRKHKLSLLFTKVKWLTKPLIIVISLVTVCSLIYKFFTTTTLFNIQKIEIEGTSQFVNKADLQTLATHSSLNSSVFKYDSNALQANLESNFQGAKKIEVKKVFPNRLLIKVNERIPLALIRSKDVFYLVDQDGYVLGEVKEGTTNLPVIEYKEDIKVGYFINKELIPLYFQLISSLDEKSLKVSSISATINHVTFYLNNSLLVYLNTKKDIESSVLTLSKLYNQLVSEGKIPSRIDLRYDKVIVSFE